MSSTALISRTFYICNNAIDVLGVTTFSMLHEYLCAPPAPKLLNYLSINEDKSLVVGRVLFVVEQRCSTNIVLVMIWNSSCLEWGMSHYSPWLSQRTPSPNHFESILGSRLDFP